MAGEAPLWAVIAAVIVPIMTALILAATFHFNRKKAKSEMHMQINKVLHENSVLHHEISNGSDEVISILSMTYEQKYRDSKFVAVTSYYSVLEAIATHYKQGVFSIRDICDYFGERLLELKHSQFHRAMQEKDIRFRDRHSVVYRLCDKVDQYLDITRNSGLAARIQYGLYFHFMRS